MTIQADLKKFLYTKPLNESKSKKVKKEEKEDTPEKKEDHPVLKEIKNKLKLGDKSVQEVYKDDPKKLANDLAKAVGDEKEATGLLAYMANTLGPDKKDIFDKALSAMKQIDPDKDDDKNEEEENDKKGEEKEEKKEACKSKKESIQKFMALAVEEVMNKKSIKD